MSSTGHAPPCGHPSQEGILAEQRVEDWEYWKQQHLSRFTEMRRTILPYEPHLKELARKLRKNMTLGEVILWKHLKGKQMHGYDFDRQRPINRFIVDFYCKDLMLAIEIDGSSHDSKEAQQRDAERQARLESLGVRFLRFREGEVRHQTTAVLAAIEEWVLQHQA